MDEYGSVEDDWRERGVGGKLGVPDCVIHFAAYARVSHASHLLTILLIL